MLPLRVQARAPTLGWVQTRAWVQGMQVPAQVRAQGMQAQAQEWERRVRSTHVPRAVTVQLQTRQGCAAPQVTALCQAHASVAPQQGRAEAAGTGQVCLQLLLPASARVVPAQEQQAALVAQGKVALAQGQQALAMLRLASALSLASTPTAVIPAPPAATALAVARRRGRCPRSGAVQWHSGEPKSPSVTPAAPALAH